ncbi:hypothetical protein [Alistipes indistinctus]|uniref:hypothetical protein n=1 Tax=Alistipes indistinctus TaxID=626932 RepID=UPI002431E3DB|nr:hypothetical protein [Alistipes indistinctus]
MNKLLTLALVFMCSMPLHAQNDVTRFLGIPVEGSKSEIIRQLKAKGYRNLSHDSDILTGEFNGRNVNISVVTNNNKVYRIMVVDAAGSDEKSIQILFNTLCRQFGSNSRYLSLGDQTISDDEDISYEMTVHKKRYEAIFYQIPADLTSLTKNVEEFISQYMNEQNKNLSEEDILKKASECATEMYSKPVWFKINRHFGEYYIIMYYDNEYNRANGEDL